MECEACGHNNVDGARFCANCGITVAMPATGDNPLLGKVVGGRYRITGIIGEGGMGIVYEGEQQMGSTVRKVAVKTLHAELSRDPSVTARFHRECGTVAQLEHPNTIKVYDFGAMDDGTLYIAMEYLAGESLDRVIEREGALHPERVLKLLRQVGGSLEEAHGQGIIHRDLKPENVILTERAGTKDVVKLLDFGIAARTESADAEREAKLTQQGMVLGTPPYMSPEQFTGKALDRRSDIYSMAVMAYQMLTGQLPFDANTPWEWATEHMTAQPRPFETMPVSAAIPPGMRAAILKALSKDREERFSTVSEFLSAMSAGTGPQAVAPLGETGTAAMEAVPNFAMGGGAAPTAAMPLKPEAGATGGMPVAVPAAPSSHGRASAKPMGLIFGLGGVAVLLAAGIGFATLGGSDGGDATALPLPTAPEPVAVAPVATTDETEPSPAPDQEEEPQAPSEPVVAAPPKTPTKAPEKTPTATRPPPTQEPTKPPTTQPTKPPPPKSEPAPSAGNAACDACISQANAGNLSAAASSYAACGDAAKKRACSMRARVRAGQSGAAAAKSGDCAKARQILAAAQAMGAASPSLSKAVSSCK